MATGLLDFKAKYRDRLTEAITALSSGREFYCEGKFHPDPGSAIAMMMYSCVWDAFNEEGAKFNSRKLEYNASFWAKEIVCCHRVPYTNKGLLTPDSLRYYRTMGESGIQSLERLLQWLLEEEPPNNNYDKENKKIVGEAIVDIGESVSECIEIHASTSQNTQFRLLALAKNLLPSEGSCNYQESQATKTGDLFLERHGGILLDIGDIVSKERMNDETLSLLFKVFSNKGGAAIIFLLTIILTYLTKSGEKGLSEDCLQLHKYLIKRLGGTTLYPVNEASTNTMIDSILNATEESVGDEAELLLVAALGFFLKGDRIVEFLNKTRVAEFTSAVENITGHYSRLLGIDSDQAKEIESLIASQIEFALDISSTFDDENFEEPDIVNVSAKERDLEIVDPWGIDKIRESLETNTPNAYDLPASRDNGVNLKEILDSLVGLENIKNEVLNLTAVLEAMNTRKKQGLKIPEFTRHLVFLGNPGTGKTSVARILATVYQKLGFLSKGHFTEVDRSSLVGGYLGQTAIKTRRVLEKALGGVLFIDEAYSLFQDDRNDPYGSEAIDTIVKYMEDNRDDFILIVAGYPDKMNTFLDSNPGLQSRFSRQLLFADYDPHELREIFVRFMDQSEYIASEDLHRHLLTIFQEMIKLKDERFGNGRTVRSLFECTIVNHSKRMSKLINPSKSDLMNITVADVRIEDIDTAMGKRIS